MLDAALNYALLGWPVLPLHNPHRGRCSCSWRGCPGSSHPRLRLTATDATTDTGQIHKWWDRFSNANIGIKMGGTGIVVLNVDNKRGINGSANLAALAANFSGVPETLTSITGTGEHLFFRSDFCRPGVEVVFRPAITDGMCFISQAITIADGVEMRAGDCYVVVPPSLHVTGKRYVWKDPMQPVAPSPDWLIAGLVIDWRRFYGTNTGYCTGFDLDRAVRVMADQKFATNNGWPQMPKLPANPISGSQQQSWSNT